MPTDKLPENFSYAIYKDLHNELKNYTNDELKNHYLSIGEIEGWFYNFNCYLNYTGIKKIYDLNTPNNFNFYLYKNIHPDLENFTNEDLEFHYYLYGKTEGRMINFNFNKNYIWPVKSYDNIDVPPDFNLIFYRNNNYDLINFTNEELKIHYFLYGKNENRIYKVPINYNSELYRKILKSNIDNLTNDELLHNYSSNNNNEINYLMNNNYSENIDFNNIIDVTDNVQNNNVFITFIIPTIGRISLIDTINSLFELNNKNWQALIILDGIKNIFNFDDKRIKIIEIEKKGFHNNNKSNAGYVRNIGINYINNTEWFAFIDDDDYISPYYIDNLLDEINKNNIFDVCVFRMAFEDKKIIPSLDCNGIVLNNVGINFSIKKNLAKEYKFTNSNCEDYLLLKKLELNNIQIIISPYVTYYVRTIPYIIEEKNIPRILINM
jgi:hypothetical protein